MAKCVHGADFNCSLGEDCTIKHPPEPETWVVESYGGGVRIKMEISGYDEPRDRPVFMGLAQMAVALAIGLKGFGPDFALRVGPILIEAINIINLTLDQFKSKPKEMQQ